MCKFGGRQNTMQSCKCRINGFRPSSGNRRRWPLIGERLSAARRSHLFPCTSTQNHNPKGEIPLCQSGWVPCSCRGLLAKPLNCTVKASLDAQALVHGSATTKISRSTQESRYVGRPVEPFKKQTFGWPESCPNHNKARLPHGR